MRKLQYQWQRHPLYQDLSVYPSREEMVPLHLAVDKVVVKEVVSHINPLDNSNLLAKLDLLKTKVVLNLPLA